MDLGKIRIDVEYMNNRIQIFNAPKVCSLVINGEVVDTFLGLVSVTFKLNGKIQTSEGEKAILVKMSLTATMRVYCDGIKIAKKWAKLCFG